MTPTTVGGAISEREFGLQFEDVAKLFGWLYFGALEKAEATIARVTAYRRDLSSSRGHDSLLEATLKEEAKE